MLAKTTITEPINNFSFIESIFIRAIDACTLKESINLKLFDHLVIPKTATELAAITGTDKSAIKAVLNVLKGHKLVDSIDNKYIVTSISAEFLVSTSPFYQGNSLLWQRKNCEHIISNISELLRKPGMQSNSKCKCPLYDAINGIMHNTMKGSIQDTVKFVKKLPGFNKAQWLCDIGDNHGRYATSLLECNSNLHAVIADLPEITSAVKETYEKSIYKHRLSVIPYNLAADYLPAKTFDIIIISYVIQLFGDKLKDVIKKIASSVVPGGWCVIQNTAPNYGVCRLYMNTMNLMTKLTAETNSFIPEKLLIDLLRKAGFCDIITDKTGMNKSHIIIAARKVD